MKIAALALLVLLSGCSTARMVEVQPGQGGVVAMAPQGSEAAREKANTLMMSNCGSRQVQVVSEGEVVVGQVTTTSAHVDTDKEKEWHQKVETQNAYATTDTHNQTEWRITYRCVDAAK